MFGVQLKVPGCQLEKFKENPPQPQVSLQRVINFWLEGKTTTDISWDSIICALESDSVNEKKISLDVQRQFMSLHRKRKLVVINIIIIIYHNCTVISLLQYLYFVMKKFYMLEHTVLTCQ